IERFVGDLLRVRTGMTAPANVYRAIGRSRFDDDKVKYDLFTQVLDGLKSLGLVFHLKGQARYRKTPFGNAPERGHAARFWAFFNNRSWKNSSGEDCYQRLSEAERLKMTINGEPVAEIDIKASFLTIYHAMVKQPLQGSGDPYG